MGQRLEWKGLYFHSLSSPSQTSLYLVSNEQHLRTMYGATVNSTVVTYNYIYIPPNL